MSVGEENDVYLFPTHTKFDSQISKSDMCFMNWNPLFRTLRAGSIYLAFFQFKGAKAILKAACKLSEFNIFLVLET